LVTNFDGMSRFGRISPAASGDRSCRIAPHPVAAHSSASNSRLGIKVKVPLGHMHCPPSSAKQSLERRGAPSSAPIGVAEKGGSGETDGVFEFFSSVPLEFETFLYRLSDMPTHPASLPRG
jgi:hypothetical protein